MLQLRRLFHGANFDFSVPALKRVEVYNCGLLEHIFGDKTCNTSANIHYVGEFTGGSSYSRQDLGTQSERIEPVETQEAETETEVTV